MFNENLKILRKEKGISQEQLAVRLNVVRQTISKWERGISIPDAQLLIELSEVLDVSVSDLLGTKIEVSEGKNELDVLANELSKLNEYLAVQGNKTLNLKRRIGLLVGILIIFFFVCTIYNTWTDLFYEFGKNLFHWLND